MKNIIKRIEDGLYNYWFPKKINLTPKELLDYMYQFMGEKGASTDVKLKFLDFQVWLVNKLKDK